MLTDKAEAILAVHLQGLSDEEYKFLTDAIYLRELTRMHRMAVWDHQGRMYVPVLSPLGRISHYGSYREATDTLTDYLEER